MACKQLCHDSHVVNLKWDAGMYSYGTFFFLQFVPDSRQDAAQIISDLEKIPRVECL